MEGESGEQVSRVLLRSLCHDVKGKGKDAYTCVMSEVWTYSRVPALMGELRDRPRDLIRSKIRSVRSAS